MRGLRFHVSLLVSISLVLTACGDSGDASTSTTAPPPSSSTSSTTTTTTIPETTTTTLPPDASAGIELPRTGVYAHVEFTVTDGTFSNRTPGTYFDDEPEFGDDRWLYLDFTADFEDGYPGVSEEFDAGDFSLVLADGTSLVSERVDFSRTIRVTDDGPVMWAWAFPGGDLLLEDASIRYDDDVHVPMEILLTGVAAADPYPIPVDASGMAEVQYDGGCGAAEGTAEVLGAEWDVDTGIDHDRDPIELSFPARALADERILRVEVRSIATAGTCGGTVFTSDAFRLVVDGLPIGSENTFATQLEDGEGIDVIIGFRVPADAEVVALEAGLAGGVTAEFPIPLPTGG